MNTRWQSLLALIVRCGQVLTIAFSALVVVAALILTLIATGNQAVMLRRIVQTVGAPFSGQRTERIEVAVQVLPESQELSAVATLTLRSTEELRPRFLFLLNPALQLQRVSAAAGGPELSVYRLSWLTIVEPKQPLAQDQTLQIRFAYSGVLPGNPPDPNPIQLNPRSIALGPEAFWYPTDAQSHFSADVRMTVPRALTVVHNSSSATRSEQGDLQTVRWQSERPIASIPLIAGEYRLSEHSRDGITYRLYLADDVELDAEHVLEHMARADRFLTERLGSAGFTSVSVYVSRELRRGVNYGNGLIGMSIRYFRGGDYGFALLAHEIAHNWWGGTVAEQWLRPATGGQWLVEGLAEFSSLMATEATFGVDALTHRLAAAFFDPSKQKAIRDMSMIDNVISDNVVRDTIYRKGSYVTYRLCSTMGMEKCFAALRRFVESHRYTQTDDAALQKVLEEAAGVSLEEWFADWVRSDRLADLKLESNPQGQVVLTNAGPAALSGGVPLWIFESGKSEPVTTSIRIGETLGVATGQSLIIDPQLGIPDVRRENNRYPAVSEPLCVAVASDGRLALTSGEPWPWSPQTIRIRDGANDKQVWQLDRGVLQPPVWFADGSHVLVSYSDADRPVPSILAIASNGTRQFLGRGTAPSVDRQGTIYAGRADKIVRFSAGGNESVVTRRPGYVLDQPLPSPDASQLAYIAARRNSIQVRLTHSDGSNDRVLFTWDRDRTILRWAPAGDKLYALLGGNADWQLWEITIADGSTRVLVRDATAVGDFALSPDGKHIAITAAPEPDYPANRKQLFILALDSSEPRRLDAAGLDFGGLAWRDNDSLLVVATEEPVGQPWIMPQSRRVKIVSLADMSIRDLESPTLPAAAVGAPTATAGPAKTGDAGSTPTAEPQKTPRSGQDARGPGSWSRIDVHDHGSGS